MIPEKNKTKIHASTDLERLVLHPFTLLDLYSFATSYKKI